MALVQQKMKKAEIKLFLLIMILATGLRFAGITFDSLWLDESYQTLVDAIGQNLPDFKREGQPAFLFRFDPPHSLNDMLSNFRKVDPLCPPLYPLLLNRWMAIFGESDLAIRLLSTFFSLSTIAITYVFARRFLGLEAAILTALVQTVSPFEISYAQEARMYSLTELTALLSCGSLLWLTQRRPYSAMLLLGMFTYSISTWAMINSHYTALFVFAFQGLYCTIYLLRKGLYKLYSLIVISWVGIACLWLPWFDYFRQAAAIRTASFYVARLPNLWWPIWAITARLPFNWISFLAGKKVVAYTVPLYVTSLTMLIAALVSTLRHDIRGRATMNTIGFLWGWALIPAIGIWLTDVKEGHKVIEISRYVIATAPAIYALAGFGLSNLWALSWFEAKTSTVDKEKSFAAPLPSLLLSKAFVPCLIVVHFSLALINNAYAHYVPQREPWRQLASKVEALSHDDDLLVVSQYYDIICLNRYLTIPRRQIGVSPTQGAKHLARILSPETRFWLITAQEGDKVKSMIPPWFQPMDHFDLGHSLHLTFYERK